VIQVYDDDYGYLPDHSEFGLPTTEAKQAMEQIRLYHWWTVERPARLTPEDVSGWYALCARRHAGDDITHWLFRSDTTDEEQQETRVCLEINQAIKMRYKDEDTAMLVRLIEIRESLVC
jgi:hypothetical protein